MQLDLSHWTPLTVIIAICVVIYVAMHAVSYCINVWRGNAKGAAADSNAIQILAKQITNHDSQLTGLAQNQIPPTAMPQILALLGQQLAAHQSNILAQQRRYTDQDAPPVVPAIGLAGTNVVKPVLRPAVPIVPRPVAVVVPAPVAGLGGALVVEQPPVDQQPQ